MKKLWKDRRILALGALALAAAGGGAYFVFGAGKPAKGEGAAEAASQDPPPANVVVAKAVEALLAPSSDAPGSVVGLRDSLNAAETSGKIVWIADVGAELDEGDVIARIDPADAKFARDSAAADAGRLQARANYLAKRFDRFSELGDESGESQASLDQMRSERDEAAQTLAQARVALERAEANLARTEVRASFAGRLVAQETQIGEYVNPGSPIARIVDTRHLEVTAQAPSSLLKSIRPGEEIEVAFGAEKVKAPVRAIVPVSDVTTRTMEIRLSLPDDHWTIGSAVRVALPQTSPRPVVAADRDAIVLRADRISVFVVGEDKIARQVDVELGAAEGELIELIGEVKAGDALVIRGGERLRDGQPVNVSTSLVADAKA